MNKATLSGYKEPPPMIIVSCCQADGTNCSEHGCQCLEQLWTETGCVQASKCIWFIFA